jgi:hypothetical protein
VKIKCNCFISCCVFDIALPCACGYCQWRLPGWVRLYLLYFELLARIYFSSKCYFNGLTTIQLFGPDTTSCPTRKTLACCLFPLPRTLTLCVAPRRQNWKDPGQPARWRNRAIHFQDQVARLRNGSGARPSPELFSSDAQTRPCPKSRIKTARKAQHSARQCGCARPAHLWPTLSYFLTRRFPCVCRPSPSSALTT